MDKFGNVVIYVQIVLEINWKQSRAKKVSMQIYICRGALNLN